MLRLDVVLPSGRCEKLESEEFSTVGELRTLVTWRIRFFFLEGLVNLGGSPFRFFSKLVNISPISRWFFVGDISNSFSWDFFRHLSLGGAFPGRDAAGIQGGKLPLDRGF